MDKNAGEGEGGVRSRQTSAHYALKRATDGGCSSSAAAAAQSQPSQASNRANRRQGNPRTSRRSAKSARREEEAEQDREAALAKFHGQRPREAAAGTTSHGEHFAPVAPPPPAAATPAAAAPSPPRRGARAAASSRKQQEQRRTPGLFGNAVRAAQPAAAASPRLPRPGFEERTFFGLEDRRGEEREEGPLLARVARAAREGGAAAERLHQSEHKGAAAVEAGLRGLERELDEATLLRAIGTRWLN